MFRPIQNRTAIAFLAGFTVCYLGGAYLAFNLLMTLNYTIEDAAPRAALWWWTARVGNDMMIERLRRPPYRITIP